MIGDAKAFVSLMRKAGSQLGHELASAWSRPLGDYLQALIPIRRAGGPHFRKVQDSLLEYCTIAGINDGAAWCDTLQDAPIIQQADHAGLLLDEETLLNNTLFAIATKLAGRERAITVQCSAVTCISKYAPLRGPTFLSWRGGTYNIFGRSKTAYKNVPFIGLPSPVTVRFSAMTPQSQSAADDRYLSPFIGHEWPGAVDAFYSMNSALWHDLDHQQSAELLVSDDRWTYRLVAKHLGDRDSPLHRIVFDSDIRQAFLQRKRDLIASSMNIGINRPEPDHFWYRPCDSNRLYPVVFPAQGADPVFLRGEAISTLNIPMTPSVLVAAMERGQIIPDIVLIYLARCLLPGIDAVGGTSQQDYVSLYQRLMLDCDDRFGLLTPNERAVVARRAPSRLGGAPLLELTLEERLQLPDALKRRSISEIVGAHLNRRIGETVGALQGSRYLAEHAIRSMERL